MTQNERLQTLIADIEPLRKKLVDHTVYGKVKSLDDLKLFMQQHIFAVWDFMSLLKYLQAKLTCISIPWVPVGDPQTRYLINEIVTDEECDENEKGVRMSHFELYLQALKNANASTEQIEKFIELIKSGTKPAEALKTVDASAPVQKFVNSTFDIIEMDKPHIAAAVFTFSREDLIPGMFISFVRALNKEHEEGFLSDMIYYLQRHVEVDGDVHAELAHQMTAILCGDDEQKWAEATEEIKKALQQRIDFWDGIGELMTK